MRAYTFETYDVFTDKKFSGNQLAVLMDAQGLTEDEMRAITREFNYAETTFVLPPENPDHTARVRIFTPGYEMPFAGHPTVGTAIAIAKARNLSGEVLLELKAGLFPVKVDLNGKTPFAEFQNPNVPKETGAAPSVEALEEALSLPQGALDREDHRPRLIGAGVDYVYVRAPLDMVRQARVDNAAFDALNLETTVGVLLYASSGDGPDTDYHVRMFAPGAGVLEDAATGSAAAAFPGQVAVSDDVADGEHCWVIEQGIEMGRPSRIIATVMMRNGGVEAVRIGGHAIQVQEGQLFL